MSKLLLVVHPIEKFGPESGGAISIICHNLLSIDTQVEVVATSHSKQRFTNQRTKYIDNDKLVSRLVCKLFYSVMHLPYKGHVTYLLSVAIWILKNRQTHVVCFNDSWFVFYLARFFPNRKFFVWYQNEPRDIDGLRLAANCANVQFLTCSDWVGKQLSLSLSKNASPKCTTVRSGAVHHPLVQLRKQSNEVSLLYVGRLDPNKGVDIAIETLKLLRERSIDCKLTIVGDTWFYEGGKTVDDEYKKRLYEMAAGLPITFTGHVPHLSTTDYYARADYLLVPSRVPEPAGLVAIEGMVNGCIVIGRNLGGLPEYLLGLGTVVNSGEPQDWCEVICNSIASGDLHSSRSARAERCKLVYSWKNTRDSLSHAVYGG